jgi:hypothetical protein
MFLSRTALRTAVCVPLMFAACQQPAPVTQQAESVPEQAVAAVPETPEPGRQQCGLVSLVLPEGAIMNIETEPNGGYMKGTVYIAEGKIFDIFYTGGQDMYPGYSEDAALRAQTERWVESVKTTSMDPGWTPEITPLQGPHLNGYYALVKHDPNSQPPNEYIRHTWPKHAYSLRGFFNLDGNVLVMGGDFNDDVDATCALYLSIMKTGKWAGQ